MWSIAVKTLLAERGKMFTALVGVVFSIILVNVQGGLFLGLIRKASMLVDHGQADVWVGHKQMRNVDFPHDIPRRWIHRVRRVPGVERAEPYLVGHATMLLPSGGFEVVFVVGVDEASLLGNVWNLRQGTPQDILRSDGIIIDELEDPKLDYPKVGDIREISGIRSRVAAKSSGVMGFLVNPYVFTTYDRAAQYLRVPPDSCSYYLVQVAPGVDPKEVCRLIRQQIPHVEAYTRDEYSWISVSYWMTRTGLGISFGASTLLGLLVGLVMVAQTLYAMVLDRLSEFAALKAIGASDRQIFGMLIVHAVTLAVTGSLVGLLIVTGIQHWASTPKAPILIPAWVSLGSFALVLLICLVSAILPYLRVRKLDPASVLQ